MKSLQFKFQTGCSSYGSNTWKVGFPLLRTWGKNNLSLFHSLTWLWSMSCQCQICSMQAFFLINNPWLLPYYQIYSLTHRHPQDQRVRVARSAHEVDPLQPELRPACANTTRVETPRIAVWDIWTNLFGNNTKVLLKWKMKFLSYLIDYFQMHWHANKDLFSETPLVICEWSSMTTTTCRELRFFHPKNIFHYNLKHLCRIAKMLLLIKGTSF